MPNLRKWKKIVLLIIKHKPVVIGNYANYLFIYYEFNGQMSYNYRYSEQKRTCKTIEKLQSYIKNNNIIKIKN